MEERTVQVGIFWAVPNKIESGWNFYEVKKSYPISAANTLGFIDYTYGDIKVLIELGKALDGGDEQSDLEKAVLKTKYDAVVVSHYHADHAGLIEYKTDCPVYIGCGAYRIIKAMNEYRNASYVGKTGDFRFHGRKDKEKLLYALPKSVNVLICEGTNIGSEKPCFTERELENKLAEIMRKTDKPVFVLQSGSNIDRLVSVYRAAKRSGRILYEDNYTALIASAAGGKIPRPDVFDDVYAFTPRPLQSKRKDMFFEFENKRGLRAIVHSGKFVMVVRPSMCGFMNRLYNSSLYIPGSTLVYSMWSGYKQEKATAKFLDCATDMFMNIIDTQPKKI